MCKKDKSDIEQYQVRIIVAGSRNYDNYTDFVRYLEDVIRNHKLDLSKILFISGKAKGPDSLIIRYCEEYGYDWVEYPADWDNIHHPNALLRRNDFGKLYDAKAGYNRNIDMAKVATHLIAYWDKKSNGTKHMLKIAAKYHLNVDIIHV